MRNSSAAKSAVSSSFASAWIFKIVFWLFVLLWGKKSSCSVSFWLGKLMLMVCSFLCVSLVSFLELFSFDAFRINFSRDVFSAWSFLMILYCFVMGLIWLSFLFVLIMWLILMFWCEMSVINFFCCCSAVSFFFFKAFVEDVEDEYDFVLVIVCLSVDLMCMSWVFWNFGVIICILMGKLFVFECLVGMDIVGKFVSDAGIVMTSAAYVCVGFSVLMLESFGVVDMLDGVSNIFMLLFLLLNMFVKLFDINFWIFCVFLKYFVARALFRVNVSIVMWWWILLLKFKFCVFVMVFWNFLVRYFFCERLCVRLL